MEKAFPFAPSWIFPQDHATFFQKGLMLCGHPFLSRCPDKFRSASSSFLRALDPPFSSRIPFFCLVFSDAVPDMPAFVRILLRAKRFLGLFVLRPRLFPGGLGPPLWLISRTIDRFTKQPRQSRLGCLSTISCRGSAFPACSFFL